MSRIRGLIRNDQTKLPYTSGRTGPRHFLDVASGRKTGGLGLKKKKFRFSGSHVFGANIWKCYPGVE